MMLSNLSCDVAYARVLQEPAVPATAAPATAAPDAPATAESVAI